MTIKKFINRVKRWDWSPQSVLRTAGSGLIIIVALAIILVIFSALKTFLFGGSSMLGGTRMYEQDYARNSITSSFVDEVGEAFALGGGMAERSVKMIAADSAAIMPTYDDGGADAEEYERHSYNSNIEAAELEEVCKTVEALKPLEYVVFDTSHASERSCSYNFRVEIAHEEEIVAFVKELDPESFTANIDTLEERIEYNDSEIDMLERRIAMLADTIAETETAYSELITAATTQKDTSSLATIINNKINTLNNLTQQKANAEDRLARLTRSAEGVTEQIEYAHFDVYISKRVVFDWENIKDAWQYRLEDLAGKVNDVLVGLTLGLLVFLLSALQFLVYSVIVILLATMAIRGIWGAVRFVWNWKR